MPSGSALQALERWRFAILFACLMMVFVVHPLLPARAPPDALAPGRDAAELEPVVLGRRASPVAIPEDRPFLDAWIDAPGYAWERVRILPRGGAVLASENREQNSGGGVCWGRVRARPGRLLSRAFDA